jgi:UPF0716 family protein affecting phage T7 exclusion
VFFFAPGGGGGGGFGPLLVVGLVVLAVVVAVTIVRTAGNWAVQRVRAAFAARREARARGTGEGRLP